MKVVVTCGGTGGHAFPGIAVAQLLREQGHEVVVWDSGRDIESSVMKSWQGDIFSTGARPLSLKNAFAIWRSFRRCVKFLKKNPCDIMLAMGSYSSLPPVLAARRCSIKVVLHEANTVPGRAVEFLSRFAEKVAVSFESTKNYLPSAQCVRTGLPVRPAITQGRRFEGIPENSFVVFVTGGSQGAHAVNELVQHAFELLKTELESREGEKRPLYVIHQTGFADEGLVRMTYAKANIHSRVRAFEDRMSDAYASADFVIARAGASTCFELALVGKPALLVPLPTSMRNHQHFNAEAFASVRAADEGIQGNLTARQLSRYLLHVYDNPGKCSEMAERMKHLATPDAAQNLVRLLEEIYAAK